MCTSYMMCMMCNMLQGYNTGIHNFFKLYSTVVILAIFPTLYNIWGFPGGTSGKEPTCQCRRPRCGLNSCVEKIPLEEGVAINSSSLAWRILWTEETIVHRVTKSQTRLKQLSKYACI